MKAEMASQEARHSQEVATLRSQLAEAKASSAAEQAREAALHHIKHWMSRRATRSARSLSAPLR